MDTAHKTRPLVKDLENVLEAAASVGYEEHQQARTRGGNDCPATCERLPTSKQGLRVGVVMWLLLWVAAVVTLTVAVKIRFAQQLNTVHKETDDSSLDMSDGDTRKIWSQTAILLPSLAKHYQAHHLTVHQPHSYETQNGRQTWYFTPMQVHLRKQARADIILRADVKGMQLTLQHSKSPSATHTSYSLFLTNITVLHSHVEDPATISMSQNISHLKQSSQPEMIKILHDTWTVVDVTKYLQDWLFHGSDLWVEVITPHRLQENAKRGYPMLLFQPTVCVWDSYDDANISTSGNHLETALKGFLETSMQEKVARRLWSDSKQQGEDEKEAPRHRYKRAMHNTQCKVQWVEMSKEELGLGLVLFPDTLTLKYCAGSCHILDHSDIFSTNALFRAKYRFLRKSASMPSPHCIPTSFHHQHFFVWETSHIKMMKVWDLDAAKCGCR